MPQINNIIVHNMEQGSSDWHQIRIGKITGTGFTKLTGTPLARKKYIFEKASEIITGYKSDENNRDIGNNIHIARGNTFEPIARDLYSLKTGNLVEEVGFISLNELIGCSPDGLVGSSGMIEIKVPDTANYLNLVLELYNDSDESIPKEHLNQMQFNMYVTNRDWCDYVLYNPAYAEITKGGIFNKRVMRNNNQIEIIKNTLETAIKEIEAMKTQYYNLILQNNE